MKEVISKNEHRILAKNVECSKQIHITLRSKSIKLPTLNGCRRGHE